MLKLIITFTLILFIAIPDTIAQLAYEQEIIEYVVDPCYKVGVRDNELTEYMSESDALAAIKILAGDSVEEMIRAVSPLVADVNKREDRMLIYKLGAASCIEGMLRGR